MVSQSARLQDVSVVSLWDQVTLGARTVGGREATKEGPLRRDGRVESEALASDGGKCPTTDSPLYSFLPNKGLTEQKFRNLDTEITGRLSDPTFNTVRFDISGKFGTC